MDAGRSELWDSYPWLVVLSGDSLHRAKFADPSDLERATARVQGGDSPRDVFGWSGQRLPLSAVRSVEWVPAASTLLVKRGWWRDPWRLPFPAAEEGERAFRDLAGLLPGAAEPTEARVGPNDLPMDPRLGVGALLAFLGVVVLVLGAVEGIGQAPLQGPARRFAVLAELGVAMGVEAAIGLGVAAFAVGVGGLVWWYKNRPKKQVIRAVGAKAS